MQRVYLQLTTSINREVFFFVLFLSARFLLFYLCISRRSCRLSSHLIILLIYNLTLLSSLIQTTIFFFSFLSKNYFAINLRLKTILIDSSRIMAKMSTNDQCNGETIIFITITPSTNFPYDSSSFYTHINIYIRRKTFILLPRIYSPIVQCYIE